MRIKLHFIALALLLVFSSDSVQYVRGQSPAGLSSSKVFPESGFLSPQKYTNAFFGFSLPLPSNFVLNEQTLSLAHGDREHLLLAFHSPEKELVSFTITAREVGGESERSARKAASLSGDSKVQELEIGGKRCWTGQFPRTVKNGQMKTVVFATTMDGYVLEFKFVSFSLDTTTELERTLERLSFFDPVKSKLMAGTDSKPYLPGATPFATSRISQLGAGSIAANSYRNEDLRFHYEFPHDWVLMSKAVGKEFSREGTRFLWGNSPAIQQEHDAESRCAKELLFVRRFLETPTAGQSNPVIILVAADPKCISAAGFPKSVEERDSVQTIAHDTLTYFRTSDSLPTGPMRSRAFTIADHIMIEISQSFTPSTSGQTSPASVVLSSFLMMESEGYWVIWIFAGHNEAEMKEMKSTKIFFDNDVAPTIGSKSP